MYQLITELRKGSENLCQTWDEAVALMSLVCSRKPRAILEIGTRKGGSAILMAEALAQLKANGTMPEGAFIDAVDPIGELAAAPQRKHLLPYINLIIGKSPSDVPDKLYDVIHIDGDHQYDAVMADLQVAALRSHKETAIILHDANYPDVRRALETFALSHANAHVIYDWTKRPERSDDWGGQALVLFKG